MSITDSSELSFLRALYMIQKASDLGDIRMDEKPVEYLEASNND